MDCSPWSRKESDMTGRLSLALHWKLVSKIQMIITVFFFFYFLFFLIFIYLFLFVVNFVMH